VETNFGFDGGVRDGNGFDDGTRAGGGHEGPEQLVDRHEDDGDG
jgi:hypothetical protein